MGTGLTEEIIGNIKEVMSKYVPVESAFLYGSRAKGNYDSASDIDITLKGKNIDLSLITKIENELDDLMLPYKFDLSIFDRIKNSELIDHINRVGIEIYKR